MQAPFEETETDRRNETFWHITMPKDAAHMSHIVSPQRYRVTRVICLSCLLIKCYALRQLAGMFEAKISL